MKYFVWILFYFPLLAQGRYDFNRLKDCFMKTQGTHQNMGMARFVDNFDDVTTLRPLNNGTNETPLVDSQILNSLIIQEDMGDHTLLHVIQDLRVSHEPGGFKNILTFSGSHYFQNIRQSFRFPKITTDTQCDGKSDYLIRVGTRCVSNRGKRCTPQFTIAEPGPQGPCPIDMTFHAHRVFGGSKSEAEPDKPSQENGEDEEKGPFLLRGQDLTYGRAEALIRKAIVDRLRNLQVALRNSPESFSKSDLIHALNSPGSCKNVLSTPDQAIYGEIAVALCELDRRDPALCQQGDIFNPPVIGTPYRGGNPAIRPTKVSYPAAESGE